MNFKRYQELKPLAEKIDALSHSKVNKSHKDYVARINRVGKIIRCLDKELKN